MSYESTVADLQRKTRKARLRQVNITILNTCIIVGSIYILFKVLGPSMQERRAAEQHYCGQLAVQVVAGDLELNRYMATDCPLTILAATEGLNF